MAAPGLNFTAPNTTGTNLALNGNDPANRTAISSTVGGFSWLPGQSLVIRWTDVDDGGSDDGLGIDDLSFSSFLARNLIWNPAGPGGNTWSTSPAAMNWLDGGSLSSFNNGDIANFTNDGVGQIFVGAGGVQPGATNFSHEAGTYGLVGSGIGGSGALTKTGNGILLFDNAHKTTLICQ